MSQLSCFRACDIRGELGTELNEDIAWRIGRACGEYLRPERMVIGGDARLTSEALKLALARGLQDAGADVYDIGLSGAEEVYFATFHLQMDGGIEVTASHNPINYNGMKLVRSEARPVSGDSGLREVQRLAEAQNFLPVSDSQRGSYRKISVLKDYVDHLMGYIDLANFTRPLTVVINSGNGAAGHVIDEIEKRFRQAGTPVEIIRLNHEADGNFPNGIPNPLLAESRQQTAAAVRAHQADIGIAFDGDFDRCFLFDEQAEFIEGYYIVGLLAEAFLRKEPGAKIIHDPRLVWNTIEVVTRAGGIPVMAKTGHAFIKEKMRAEDAVYGGEMSAHHYFRDFAYCDSGMIPWLLIIELMSSRNRALSELCAAPKRAYPCSGEINYRIDNAGEIIARIEQTFRQTAVSIDRTDGLGIDMAEWRLNLRSSNTEPLLRLNIETRGNPQLASLMVYEMNKLIKG